MLSLLLLLAAQIDGLRLPDLDGWKLEEGTPGGAPPAAEAVYRRGPDWIALGRGPRSPLRSLSAEAFMAWARELEDVEGGGGEPLAIRGILVNEHWRGFLGLGAAGARHIGLARFTAPRAEYWVQARGGEDVPAVLETLLAGIREGRRSRFDTVASWGPGGFVAFLLLVLVRLWRRGRLRGLIADARREY